MTWHARDLPRSFEACATIGYRNLVVSGCSFTWNNSTDTAVSWPYYVRDLAGFDHVFDCSQPGAGNQHICQALIWSLMQSQLDPQHSLVVVMWSGANRDDIIARAELAGEWPGQFSYSSQAISGVTGGADGVGNLRPEPLRLDQFKDRHTRSIENFLWIETCAAWLESHGYRFVFLEYLNKELPKRTQDFDIRHYLPSTCVERLSHLMAPIMDIYQFCLRRDLLWHDDFHPSADGHLAWSREILVPYLQTLDSRRPQ